MSAVSTYTSVGQKRASDSIMYGGEPPCGN